MGKILNQAQLSEITVVIPNRQKNRVNLENFEKLKDNIFLLEKSDEYDNHHLMLINSHDINGFLLYIDIPRLMKVGVDGKVDAGLVKKMMALIEKKIGFSISEELLFSFKFRAYESIDSTVEEYFDSIDYIEFFPCINIDKDHQCYQNTVTHTTYKISDPNKERLSIYPDSKNIIKHELIYDNLPETFGKDLCVRFLETQELFDGVNTLLERLPTLIIWGEKMAS